MFVFSVDTFVEFFTGDGFRDFLHEGDSLDFVFFFDGVDLLLHLFVHSSLLFFDVVNGCPGEFFLVVDLLEFVLDFQQEDGVAIDLFVRFLIGFVVFEIFFLVNVIDLFGDFLFRGSFVFLDFLVVVISAHGYVESYFLL